MTRKLTPRAAWVAALALAGSAALATAVAAQPAPAAPAGDMAPAAAPAADAAPAAPANTPADRKADRKAEIRQQANAKSAAELARLTKGRTAGKPQRCIYLRNIRSSQIVNNTAIVFTGIDGTIYVNTPASGASFLRDGLTLVIDTSLNQLCNVDIVRLLDVTTQMGAGSVGLGQFVPYPRPERAKTAG